ncbi:MAG: peptidase M16 [Magnetococcales bacterium]|nr:insulinase family protein [Magnetococcales bacterium]NGZ26172.1 peptidase M16 [Magnetococcales bacterium]
MPAPHFELLQTQKVDALNLTVESYRHPATGARHLHLSAADPQNAFLVAFLTVPEDSTGVAHILEHTVLSGSERFPVRDPFFMMLRRSMATFMNAFTSSDWTAYPFATQIRKDFDNLLQVYLDAAFFPRLDILDFCQEGCRVELANEEDNASELVFKGVVFNEMKGAMSSPARQLWERMSHHIFPTTTYHYNSGGDPKEIPNLTHDQLVAFHQHHYHPSNAIFMTYGDIPASEHQQVFQEQVLCRFSRLDETFAVPDEQRQSAPIAVEEYYGVDNPEEDGKTHVVVGWLLGKSLDTMELLSSHLLFGVLMDNSSCPLQHALETSELGTAPSPICTLDDSNREMLLIAGLEGVEPANAQQVEEMILAVIRQVAEEGVPQYQVEAILHQLELSRREITGDGMPYGLRLMLNALTPAIHHGDPVAALAMDSVMEHLQQAIQDPEFIKGLARRWLLDNPHRVRLTMMPDKTLNARMVEEEKARLANLRSSLDDSSIEKIRQGAIALRKRQEQKDDPEILPRLERSDIPKDMRIPEGKGQKVAGLDATWFDQPTNGLSYLQLVIDLPDLEPELAELIPMFTNCLTDVGLGERDYQEVQALQSAVTGGISAYTSVRSHVDDVQRFQGVLVINGKALSRNNRPFSQLLRDTFTSPRFDELDRLRELVAQFRSSAELRVTDHGHHLAISTAESGMSPASAINNGWGGMVAVARLKQLDDSFADEQAVAEFAARLTRLRERIQQAPRQLLVIGEGHHHEQLARDLEASWQGIAEMATLPKRLAHPPVNQQVRLAWATNTQVNFCAKAYATVPYSHPDAPVLSVLVNFLRNGYLHRAIREQGGAYGGGAGYNSDAGSFNFYSYRDPRLAETLADFDRSLVWLQETKHDERALEEAVLGVIGGIDRPGSPAGEARSTFHSAYHGRTPAMRRQFRARILEVTIDDLQRVARDHLQPERANIGVVSNSRNLAENSQLPLEVRTL